MASPPSPPPPPEPARIHSLPNLRTLGLPSDCFEIPEGSLDVAMVNTDDPNSIEAQFLQLSNCILGSSADFATKVGLGVGIELKRTGKAFSLATLNHLETSVLEKGATGDLWSQLFELETNNNTNTNTNPNNNYHYNTLITTPSSPNNTSSVLSSSLSSSSVLSSSSSGFVGVESGGGIEEEEEEEEEERKLFGEGDQLVIDHHGFIVDEDSYTSNDSSDRKAEREASEKWLLGLTNWDAFLKDKLKMVNSPFLLSSALTIFIPHYLFSPSCHFRNECYEKGFQRKYEGVFG
jgi:hypothetical protein